MPRIKLLSDRSDLPPEQLGEYDAIVATLHRVGGPFAVLLHSPGLAQKVMEAGAQVRLNSLLTSPERELAILAVAREKDGVYEWASHVRTGREGGLREEAIEAVRNRADLGHLEPDERAIVEFVRQLLRTNHVEDDLFSELVARHGERWVVELTATVGQYQYIAAVNAVFEVVPAEGADVLPV